MWMQLFFNYLGNTSHPCHLHQDRLCTRQALREETRRRSTHRHNKSRGDASKGENRPSSLLSDVLGASSLISLVRPEKGGWCPRLKRIRRAGENHSSMWRDLLWVTGGGRWEVITGNHRTPDTVCGPGVLVLTHHCLWCHDPHWGKLF